MLSSTRPAWVRRLDELHLLTPLRVLLIVLVALLANIVVRRLVGRFLRRIFERALPSDGARAEVRRSALKSALSAAVVGVIWAVAVITVISEVGINIGGFVATATVVGGAIAFGAQTLIRDIIAGFFVLADDQYGVGDEIDLGLAAGTVERVTLRTVRLRDGEGKIWHVTHGNVLRVANLSKDAVAFLDLEVAKSMDAGEVLAHAGTLAQQLHELPALTHAMLSAPTVVGITGITDVSYIVRVTAPTQPSRRDEVTRTWRRLVLDAIAAGTIIAPPPRNAPLA